MDFRQSIKPQGHKAEIAESVAIRLTASAAFDKKVVGRAFQESDLSKRELARRMGKTENEARRILDPDHRSKLGPQQEALHVLGKRVAVTVLAAT